MTEYDKIQLSKVEILKNILLGFGICTIVDYLFYESVWMMILWIPLQFLFLYVDKKQKIKKRKERLWGQFLMALKSMGTSLYAGYSMENAVRACRKELELLYGKQSELVREFRYMESQMEVSVPLEKLFLDLGERSRISDIENFAAVYQIARKTGGNLGEIMKKTSRMLEEKKDTEQEIMAAVAGRKAEQQIMSLMPAGIIFYLKMTSPGFLDVMYGNFFGILCMTIFLGIYIGAWILGIKIVEIRV
ncbi:MAG: type II secretion system F family protein [Eubacteriales bacterium]|nr:type II secretion system F family protein [Eubacteriales bacterium]